MTTIERKPAGAAWVRLALVVLVGVAAYSNSLGVPFHFDEKTLIEENMAVGSLGAFLSGHPSPQRFLAFLSFALNGSLGGRDPLGFHLFNLAIHLGAALCVGALADAVIRHATRNEPEASAWRSWGGTFAALVFVAHPVQTQAVTYVVQRMASMAALLSLGAVLAHVRSLEHPWGARRGAWVAGGLALMAAACLTKENAVVLPVLVALVDLVVAEGTARERAVRLAPWIAPPILALVVLWPHSGAAALAGEFREWSVPGMSDRAVYLLTQPRVLVTYLRLLVVPVGQNFDYEYPAISSAASIPFLASAGALLALLIGAAAVAVRMGPRRPVARLGLFALLWFAVALAVESSVFPLSDLINEHRLYLPSVGPIVALGAALAAGIGRLSPRGRAALVAGCVAAIAALGVATWRRNELWRDPCALWGDAVAKSPGKGRPYAWLAKCYEDGGEPARALSLLERAASLPRGGPAVLLSLANLQVKLGQPDTALRTFAAAWAVGGDRYPGARQGRGLALLALGRTEEACALFEEELASRPGSRSARQNVANCRYARGDLAGALKEWAALAVEPGAEPEALYNLAVGQAAIGDVAAARRSYRAFLGAAGPDLAEARAAAERWLAANGG